MLKMPNSSGNFKDLLDKITYRQWVIMAVMFSCMMGLFVFFSLSGVDSNAESAAKEIKVKVVVAKQDIPERTILKEEMLKVIEVPADIAPAGAFSEVSEAADRPTCAAIQQGDIVTDKKVYTDVRMAGFTGTIPPNCRAVSVAITDITGVSGFAKAGDYVDIMVVSGKKEDGLKGEVLMQNVLLLGINKTGEQAVKDDDKKDDSKDKSKDKSEGNIEGSKDAMATATLALPLNEALKLAVASQKGTIYLALRPYNPTDIFTLDKDFYMPGDKREAAPAPQAAAPAPAPAARPVVSAPAPAPAPKSAPVRAAAPSYESGIEVIRGVKSSRVGGN